jgi:Na+-translocating ferredoxin:NAD+ oxidoreductase subunit C
MRLLGLRTFRHGVHPPESKDDTRGSPIRQFPFAPLLVVPLVQHAGKPSLPVVREGQEVVRGQRIARPTASCRSRCTRRPRACVRLALAPSHQRAHGTGGLPRALPGLDAGGRRRHALPGRTATPAEIVAAIQEAGIVGLGGAAFPTHVKLQIPEGKSVDTLILNGAECEPFLTTDHRVMLEQRDDITTGHALPPARAGAGAGDRRRRGEQARRRRAPARRVAARPAGVGRAAARQVPAGRREDADRGAARPRGAVGRAAGGRSRAGVNVATAAEIGRLLPRGRGIQERVVTIAGPAVRKKGNYRIPIGTPLRFLLERSASRRRRSTASSSADR